MDSEDPIQESEKVLLFVPNPSRPCCVEAKRARSNGLIDGVAAAALVSKLRAVLTVWECRLINIIIDLLPAKRSQPLTSSRTVRTVKLGEAVDS